MEALAAVSLAGNVCQFVDFASKVLREGKQVSISGTSLSVRHLGMVTEDLRKLLASLNQHVGTCRSMNGTGGQPGPLRSEEQALLDIAKGCEEVVESMLDGLKKYPQIATEGKKKTEEGSETIANNCDTRAKPKRTSLNSKSIRNALALVWGSKHLAEMQDRLNSYRAEISLRLLVFLTTNQNEQVQTLSRLESASHAIANRVNSGYEDIVEVLSVQYNTLKLELDREHQVYTDLVNTSRDEAERRHAETIAAIVTHRDGHRSTIASSDATYGNNSLLREAVRSDQIFTSRTFRRSDTNNDIEDHGVYSDISPINLSKFTNQILKALEFREMNERQAGVAEAYDHTFEWIYDACVDADVPWYPFAEWLRSGSGIYWINGKAGSGKSTLMKYLNSHQSTRELLGEWSKNKDLIVGTFFFWYAGTPPQRSQHGLLRSLLLFVLRDKIELVPVLFPNVVRALQSGQQTDPLELTTTELKTAFEQLVETDALTARICFIIDGLDEYEGEHEELVQLFANLTRSSRVKIVVSSRPIPACAYAFSKCPALRLQDLTLDDIWYFTYDQLVQHPLMIDFETERSGVTKELVNAITSKASGVFLWVAVVVKLLMRGLRDYDDLEDLHRKINDLPDELEDLFSHMLRSMSLADRVTGSRFLQIVLKSWKIHGHYPLTPLQLSFTEENFYELSNIQKITAITAHDEKRRIEKTEGRLRSRCCGLVEIERTQSYTYDVVGFLHRTVVEFLERPETCREIRSWVMRSNFNVAEALLYSSLAELKAKLLPPRKSTSNDNVEAFRAMARLLTFEYSMDGHDRQLCHEIYMPEATKVLFSMWGEELQGKRYKAIMSNHERLLVIASLYCTEAQLKPLLDVSDGSASPEGMDIIPRSKIAAYLLSEYADEPSVTARIIIAEGIAACHGNPNESVALRSSSRWNSRFKLGIYNSKHATGWTIWQFYLHYLNELMVSELDHEIGTGLLDTVFDIGQCMLDDGAERRATVLLFDNERTKRKNKPKEVQHHAHELLREFCGRAWEIKLKLAHGQNESLSQLAQKFSKIQAAFPTAENRVPQNSDYNGHLNTSTGWDKTPWADYSRKKASSKDCATADIEKSENLRANSGSNKIHQSTIVERWQITKPSQRKQLLCELDRHLVDKLCRQDLSLREQRHLFSEVMQRDANTQDRIFDCVEAEKTLRASSTLL